MTNQFPDATKKVLSPAAQAVLDAFLGDAENTGLQMDDLRKNVADAIRAAADWVIPMWITPWGSTLAPVLTAQESRERILAIAAELEAFSE
jgi:hypothetical protein